MRWLACSARTRRSRRHQASPVRVDGYAALVHTRTGASLPAHAASIRAATELPAIFPAPDRESPARDISTCSSVAACVRIPATRMPGRARGGDSRRGILEHDAVVRGAPRAARPPPDKISGAGLALRTWLPSTITWNQRRRLVAIQHEGDIGGLGVGRQRHGHTRRSRVARARKSATPGTRLWTSFAPIISRNNRSLAAPCSSTTAFGTSGPRNSRTISSLRRPCMRMATSFLEIPNCSK